ncbi:hypothetical protein BLNAU_11800 [Blattamonas nauphoetae]|uniref:Uncharacterized protein n=1 Tax=Blattamonas nauphoetae TaxID=2049346 RepID=A0ABQ9XRF5_9EUKA|nr:hypothetical protein BLNAU_11800 [Blattamonas nauphoetae]
MKSADWLFLDETDTPWPAPSPDCGDLSEMEEFSEDDLCEWINDLDDDFDDLDENIESEETPLPSSTNPTTPSTWKENPQSFPHSPAALLDDLTASTAAVLSSHCTQPAPAVPGAIRKCASSVAAPTQPKQEWVVLRKHPSQCHSSLPTLPSTLPVSLPPPHGFPLPPTLTFTTQADQLSLTPTQPPPPLAPTAMWVCPRGNARPVLVHPLPVKQETLSEASKLVLCERLRVSLECLEEVLQAKDAQLLRGYLSLFPTLTSTETFVGTVMHNLCKKKSIAWLTVDNVCFVPSVHLLS